jgi:hypothetical protein
MSKLTSVFFMFLTLVFCIAVANAQSIPDDPRIDVPKQLPDNSQNNPTPFPKPEPKVIKEGLLAPTGIDISNYQSLLSKPRTGLIRLLPRESYDWKVYSGALKKVDMPGGGAYFSFHFRAHPYGYGSDLSLERGALSVGFAGADYGMLTDLGAQALEQIDLTAPVAAFMLDYNPPIEIADARAEAKKFAAPFKLNGTSYTRRLRSEVSHTYLLRSIVYGRSDVLVAFQVARQDEDGSVIIAWKLLKEFSTPKLNMSVAQNQN